MGQEIAHGHFKKTDFSLFESRLRKETELLQHVFSTQGFAEGGTVGGYELEAWLVDATGQPCPENERFLARVDRTLLSPELSRFNIELNSEPRHTQGDMLRRMHEELVTNWNQCNSAAAELDATLMIIGILPTIKDGHLTLANMSEMTRYRALNEQVLRLRKGEPLELDIQGNEHLRTFHQDVMLEAAATSFQLHLQVPHARAVRAYNAAIMISAPMVAATVNSPFLFGYDLWDETRVPLFEQAVATEPGGLPRVTFGSGYARVSLIECFLENLDRYPILLPEALDEDPGMFSHLRLHNGTIWRWNRPLVGVGDSGQPHLRIEHRVVAAGPSLVDAIANAAFFYGLMHMMIQDESALERRLPFDTARTNFYEACRYGMAAHVHWFDGEDGDMQSLLRNRLLPMAFQGLRQQGFDREDIDDYLGVIEARISTGRTGAAWQRAFVQRHGRDMQSLTVTYREYQRTGKPVHEWEV